MLLSPAALCPQMAATHSIPIVLGSTLKIILSSHHLLIVPAQVRLLLLIITSAISGVLGVGAVAITIKLFNFHFALY